MLSCVATSTSLRIVKHFSQTQLASTTCILQRWYTLQSMRCKSSSCPYAILGINVPSSSSESRPKYSLVKASFIERALEHHPDRPGGTVDQFRRVRQAFESIRELSDGTSQVIGNANDDDTSHHDATNDINDDSSFDDWFFQETGTNLSFYMDSATRKEVADVVASNMSPGGLDRGGMWEMARMIAREEEAKPRIHSSSSNQVESLEAGDVIKSTTTRRQRRR